MAGEPMPGALSPEVQEKLTRLDKLEKDNAAMGYRLRQWEKIGDEMGNVLQRDSQSGLPVGFNLEEDAPSVPPGAHPLTGLVEDPAAVDAYYNALYQERLGKAGYVTSAQAQQLMNQAYAAARGDAMVWRMHDQLTSQKDYAALADQASELSKVTAQILQERGLGRPMEGAKGFDQWQYASLDALQLGADLGRLRLHEQAAAAAASTEEAKAAQGQAALSVAPAGAATPGSGEPWKTASGEVNWEKMRTETEQRAQQLGISA